MSHDDGVVSSSTSFRQVAKPYYGTMVKSMQNNKLDLNQLHITALSEHCEDSDGFKMTQNYSNSDLTMDCLPYLGIMNQSNSSLISKSFGGYYF
jgi:hypothetical protein